MINAALLPTIGFGVASLALFFTIASFWWLHARRGRIVSFAPQSFAAYVNHEKAGIRLPLVLHNTGPVPLVVTSLRLVLVDEEEVKPFFWANTRTRLMPENDDYADMPTTFSVPGRGTKEVFVQFDGAFPGGPAPEPRSYPVAVEGTLGHRRKWRRLVAFELQAGNMRHPRSYITYSNDPDFLTLEEQAQARKALREARGRKASSDVRGPAG